MSSGKLLLVGVLFGFGGGMAAAVGVRLVRGGGGTPDPAPSPAAVAGAEATPEATPEDPAATGDDAAAPEAEATAAAQVATPKPGRTRVASLRPRGGASTGAGEEDAFDELPVEYPPAQIVFGKGTGAGGASITKIVEERHNDTSIVRVELSGKARYKILQLPKRHELWIDFEEVDIPGGEKSAAGSKVHVEELRARVFEDVAIARVTVKLANEGQFTVFPSKGTGEADGRLEIMLGP